MKQWILKLFSDEQNKPFLQIFILVRHDFLQIPWAQGIPKYISREQTTKPLDAKHLAGFT